MGEGERGEGLKETVREGETEGVRECGRVRQSGKEERRNTWRAGGRQIGRESQACHIL